MGFWAPDEGPPPFAVTLRHAAVAVAVALVHFAVGYARDGSRGLPAQRLRRRMRMVFARCSVEYEADWRRPHPWQRGS